METSKRRQLVKRLLDSTHSGQTTWEVTGDDNAFLTSFPNYSIRIIFLHPGNQPDPDYYLQIINQDSQLIEEFSDTELGSDMNNIRESFRMMRDMYNTARRNALGVDKAIDDILEALGPDPNPDPESPGRLPF
jgi:hypothetical protein